MIRVTMEDLSTGETKTQDIEDDFIIITHGLKYVSHEQHFFTTGTTILTIKTNKEEEEQGQ